MQSPFGGHPLILGRPWLAIAYAYIGFQLGNMVISNGGDTKNLIMYAPIEQSSSKGSGLTLLCKSSPLKGMEIDEEIRPILTISEALFFNNEMEDDTINTFISDSDSVPNLTRSFLESVMNCNEQDNIESKTKIETIPVTPHSSVPIEIEVGKTLNINPNLSPI